MDIYRTFLAIILSFVILIGYQYFFVGFGPSEVSLEESAVQKESVATESSVPQKAAITATPATMSADVQSMVRPERDAQTIVVDTDLYTASLSEDGGSVTSFILKDYRETLAEASLGMEMVKVDGTEGFPLEFSWGSVATTGTFYDAGGSGVTFQGNTGKLVMKGRGNGLELVREYVFSKDSYLMELKVRVKNVSSGVLQGNAALHQSNTPFRETGPGSQFLFIGPAYFMNESLTEVDSDLYESGPGTVSGQMDWAGYEGTYFICAILPQDKSATSLTMASFGEDGVKMQMNSDLDTLQPGEEKVYSYKLFFGPKKLDVLKSIGSNLNKAVNFGWFDVIAQPTLYLLNFFYGIVKNYGIAIILVTIIFKAIFWPITQKGLKSMKNMQKLQPKMAKLKEKYKGDPTKMNQEVMNLYKTYKVNPLGGCLPMVLQIPVFFALYKVLLMCIELRHAPFMLWITDLSAPDRLFIGIDIPYVGGIPVLTLLMGGSMFLQQKMTPTTADPTQAKIMMFLPVLFTFMFINFASGLVLYWFVNNLLAIFQQQMINRQKKA
ncbi:protein translocase subunit yidC [Desulfocapsa sulfexigens DSM 10523]|uniref:Membrane protein insertase YidC n=1 Tax=Desulfocapsa sulfexigens (strain DSM 10523 / SB164P1) TaxID=1167006 RepID=M1P9H2_DESSD|nr:membrane protein insertase YidC [Desulfocapsa sulfexigens]AGF78307.1 protein translocase subunit yidC [Desulfocapsa sulfexigens DSM 10523]